jgi:hypothetical protein
MAPMAGESPSSSPIHNPVMAAGYFFSNNGEFMNNAFEGADVPDIDEGPADHLGLTASDHELLKALAEIEVMTGDWIDE